MDTWTPGALQKRGTSQEGNACKVAQLSSLSVGFVALSPPYLTVEVGSRAQVCHPYTRQSTGVRRGSQFLFFLGERGCRPQIKRAGGILHVSGKEKGKKIPFKPRRMRGSRGALPLQRRAERKVCGVSPSGDAGERLEVVRKWEVSLMFIFA